MEPQTYKAYLQSRIPVIKIKPTWENLIKINKTMNIKKTCDSCREFEAEINRKINENIVDSWIKSTKSNCWGIYTKNNLKKGDVVTVVAKNGYIQTKKLGCHIKTDEYGWIFHTDENLTGHHKH